MKDPCLYILASKPNGTLYVGATSDVIRRVWEHKSGVVDGFTKKYAVHTLVYFELHGTMETALLRERQIKRWRRAWKIDLIRQMNPDWRDLYPEIVG
jgi:putative endonuclease